MFAFAQRKCTLLIFSDMKQNTQKKQLTMTNLLNLLGSLFHTKLTDLSGRTCLLLGLRVNFQASLETKGVQGHDNVY